MRTLTNRIFFWKSYKCYSALKICGLKMPHPIIGNFCKKISNLFLKNISIYFTIAYKGNALVQEVGRRKILSFLRHHMMQSNPGFSVTDILDFGSRECLPTPKDRPRHPITFRTIDQKMGNHAVAMQSLRLVT